METILIADSSAIIRQEFKQRLIIPDMRMPDMVGVERKLNNIFERSKNNEYI